MEKLIKFPKRPEPTYDEIIGCWGKPASQICFNMRVTLRNLELSGFAQTRGDWIRFNYDYSVKKPKQNRQFTMQIET